MGTEPKSQQKHIHIWKKKSQILSPALLPPFPPNFSSHTFAFFVLASLGTIKMGLEKLCLAPRCAVILSGWNLSF